MEMQTDIGIVLAARLDEMLRGRAILQPRLNVIEDVCAEALARPNHRIYKEFMDALSQVHRERWNSLVDGFSGGGALAGLVFAEEKGAEDHPDGHPAEEAEYVLVGLGACLLDVLVVDGSVGLGVGVGEAAGGVG